tara:strand:+ start:684 stop:1109 length:426 start_codon:yes stop_codon:yes gene_type:complete
MIIRSSKAIITFKQKYLLQLRDNKENIFFPGFWGLFGGRQDNNEKEKLAVKREVKEETNLNVLISSQILSVNFHMIGLKKKRKITYFDCKIKKSPKITLNEGQKYNFFSFNELKRLKIVPMDFVAINCHYHKNNNFISLYR